MNPQVVLVVTWFVAGLVVAAYISFVVWRYRVERRKKEAEAAEGSAMSATIARTVERMERGSGDAPPLPPIPSLPPLPSRIAASATTATVGETPAPTSTSGAQAAAAHVPLADVVAEAATPAPEGSGMTVADRLRGISLPHDLVPLTTMAHRSATADRVAFWTDRAPVEVVGPAFADELERLRYDITTLDAQSLAAKRGDDHLMVVIHPDGPAAIVEGHVGFSSVPERAVVIEVWIPG